MTDQKRPRPIPIEVRDTERGRAGLYLVAEIADVVRCIQRKEPAEAWRCWELRHPTFVKDWNLEPGYFAVAIEADVDAMFGKLPFRLASGIKPDEKPLTSEHEQPPLMIPREPKLSSKELEQLARGDNPRERMPVPAVGKRCPRCHRTVDASRSWPCQLCSPERADVALKRSAVAAAPAFTFNKFPGFGWDPEGNG